ncbi:MAG: hypothetical protein M1331_03420 [Candidatus Marsarchaeota archaeon]|nr:hypothetical protein [Candidatus Marsarchaeota archaeon]
MKLIKIIKTQLNAMFSPNNISSKAMSMKQAWVYFYILAALSIPFYMAMNFITHSVFIYSFTKILFVNILGIQNAPFFAYMAVSPFIFVGFLFPISIIINSIFFHGFGKFVFKTFNKGYNATLTAAVYAGATGATLRWILIPFLLLSFNTLYLVIVGYSVEILAIIVLFFALASLHGVKKRKAFAVAAGIAVIIIAVVVFLVTVLHCPSHPGICYIVGAFY